ncbi:MAG TPA: hypothetical protein DGB32_05025 [Dehalococcoidia bacterium]|nr:hypothetical protein [Dehalococcoidia bacterium]
MIFIVVATLLFTPRSTRVLSPAHAAARGFEYGLVQWEISNFLDKWVHRVKVAIPGVGSSTEDKRLRLGRYFDLNEEIATANGDLDREASSPEPDRDLLTSFQEDVDRLAKERRGLRNDVEELLESAIDGVLRNLDIGEFGPLTWPPVDFRLDPTPRVLVTSPRDRIERMDAILIDSNITLAGRETVEEAIYYQDPELSAIVLGTGGVATFPTVIPEDRDLLPTLIVAAHEWLHAYLIFHPFGQAYGSGDMTTLNETVADLFGGEVGRLAYERLTGETLPPPEPFIPERDPEADPEEFNFRVFMRETRVTTDKMLADGDFKGAEAYMERRRLELQDHGIFIRKINQAYFAFTGSYGDNPGSVSPIGEQVQELRSYVENAADLVKIVQGVSSHEEFLQRLEGLRLEQDELDEG